MHHATLIDQIKKRSSVCSKKIFDFV